jgi:preprotein translocase subunit SecF
MFVITHKNLFFGLTALITIASLVAVAIFGLKFGTDFTGGTLAQIQYAGARAEATAVHTALDAAGFEGYSIREAGENGYILRAGTLTSDQRASLATLFSTPTSPASISQLTEVGPTIGQELRNKSYAAVGMVLLCIILFIAFAFRKVSKPVSSWIYGLIALVTLLHDVIVPTGFFAILGHYTGAQVDTLFVTAILTVLGFSIHDTIVVFDRVRENLRLNHDKGIKESFDITAGNSLGQTLIRSMNTSLTVIITLSALYFFGPDSTKDFSLTLLVGIIAGTYSSIFLATPLLVAVAERKKKA